MAKRKAKPNKYVTEYRKERSRIQRFIKRAEKRGYVFEDNVIPDIPKNITSGSIRMLQKLTPKELYNRAHKLDYETGEVISGQVGRDIERSQAAKKSAQTRKSIQQNIKIPSIREERQPSQEEYRRFPNEADILVNNWYATLEGLQNAPYYRALKSWMDRAVEQFGTEAVAQMLKEAYSHGYELTWEVAYKESAFMDYTGTLVNFIPDVGEYGKDTFWDILEQSEDWDTHFSPTR